MAGASERGLERVEEPAALPARAADGNKGTFGRVLIVGGNEEMIGAPVLAGMAALRAGAGLVQIALPRSVLAAALSICPELIGMGLQVARSAQTTDSAAPGTVLDVGPVGAVSPGSLITVTYAVAPDAAPSSVATVETATGGAAPAPAGPAVEAVTGGPGPAAGPAHGKPDAKPKPPKPGKGPGKGK